MTLSSSSEHLLHLVMLVWGIGLFLAVFAKAIQGESPSSMRTPLLLVAVAIVGVKFVPRVLDDIDSESPKGKSAKIHISAEAWMYTGLIAAALVVLGLAIYGVKRLKAWHNSPARAEARVAMENETLQRIREGIGDNADIQDLRKWISQLSARKSSQAAELLAKVQAELKRLEDEEEAAALQPIREGLADIQFRHDPVEPAESSASPE